MRSCSYISILAVLLLAGTAAAVADDGPAVTRPPVGSIAAQLRLRMKLMKETNGTLAASLSHNRKEWESLSPDEREKYRREAYAFLKANPQEQERLIEHYSRFIELSAERRAAYRERARWLAVVVESLTPQQRAEIENMTPDDRARVLLARKAELIQAGKLPADNPATGPATRPE